MAAKKLSLTRTDLMRRLYALHLLAAFEEFDFDLRGTPKKGSALYHDGNGNDLYAEWTAGDFLMLAWYHDSPNPMDTGHLTGSRAFDARYAKGVPAKLQGMLKRGIFLLSEPAVTAACWGHGEEMFADSPLKRLETCGSHLLRVTEPFDKKWLVGYADFQSVTGTAAAKVVDFAWNELQSNKQKFFGKKGKQIVKGSKLPAKTIKAATRQRSTSLRS